MTTYLKDESSGKTTPSRKGVSILLISFYSYYKKIFNKYDDLEDFTVHGNEVEITLIVFIVIVGVSVSAIYLSHLGTFVSDVMTAYVSPRISCIQFFKD